MLTATKMRKMKMKIQIQDEIRKQRKGLNILKFTPGKFWTGKEKEKTNHFLLLPPNRIQGSRQRRKKRIFSAFMARI